MFTVSLNLIGRPVTVVGGGTVGQRKVQNLLPQQAEITVIALEVCPESFASLPTVRWWTQPYESRNLIGSQLVFAAGPPELNAKVVADAKALGIWVNAATDPHEGDFTLPATVRHGAFELAISTGGASPAFARRIKEQLAATFGPEYGEFVDLLANTRQEILDTLPAGPARQSLLQEISEWHWFEQFRTVGRDAVKQELAAMIQTLRRHTDLV